MLVFLVSTIIVYASISKVVDQGFQDHGLWPALGPVYIYAVAFLMYFFCIFCYLQKNPGKVLKSTSQQTWLKHGTNSLTSINTAWNHGPYTTFTLDDELLQVAHTIREEEDTSHAAIFPFFAPSRITTPLPHHQRLPRWGGGGTQAIQTNPNISFLSSFSAAVSPQDTRLPLTLVCAMLPHGQNREYLFEGKPVHVGQDLQKLLGDIQQLSTKIDQVENYRGTFNQDCLGGTIDIPTFLSVCYSPVWGISPIAGFGSLDEPLPAVQEGKYQ